MKCYVFRRIAGKRRLGGAIYAHGGLIVQLTNCSFSNNEATQYGGAAVLEYITHATLSSCFFHNNTASQGGALAVGGVLATAYEIWQGIFVVDCTFSNNLATGSGGALYFTETSARISDCKFTRNTSPMACAVLFSGQSSELTVQSSLFKEHKVIPREKLDIGTICVGMAAKSIFRHVIFEDNTGPGAMFLSRTTAEIHNCFFRGNSGPGAGAIVAQYSRIFATNTSFIENTGLVAPALHLIVTNCLLQSCLITANYDDHSSISVQATMNLDVRLCQNVFLKKQSQSSRELQDFIYIVAKSQESTQAKLYFWQNVYQASDNTTYPIDRQFVAKKPMSHQEGRGTVNLTEEFSQFASGELITGMLFLNNNIQLGLTWAEDFTVNEYDFFEMSFVFTFSALPQPCLAGCFCFYSLDFFANTMDCSHRNMTALPREFLPSTEVLVMAGNNIQALESIDPQLEKVKQFDLRDNHIHTISDDVLRQLLLADVVKLSNNNLRKLSVLFQMSANLKTQFWLGHNPYECNCDMMWMRDWFQNATNVIDVDNITCAEGKFRGQSYSCSSCSFYLLWGQSLILLFVVSTSFRISYTTLG